MDLSPAQTRLLEHYRSPRCKGRLLNPTVRYRDVNPFCGDEITVELRIHGGTVTEAAFDGRGCSLSQGAASMLLETIAGKSVDELMTLDEAFIQELIGLEIGPVRAKCALLPLSALQGALAMGQQH